MFNFNNSQKPIINEVTTILQGLKEIIFGRIRKNNVKPNAAILASLKMPAAHLINIITDNILSNDAKKREVFSRAMQTQVHLRGDLVPQQLAVYMALYLNELICLEEEANYDGIFYSSEQRAMAVSYVQEIVRKTRLKH